MSGLLKITYFDRLFENKNPAKTPQMFCYSIFFEAKNLLSLAYF